MGGTFLEYYSSPAVGTNLTDGKSWASNKSPVRIVGIAWYGGSAVHDSTILVYYGQELIAELKNNHAGDQITVNASGEKLWHFMSSNKRCRAGDQINIEVVSAAAAVYHLWVDIREG